MFVHGSQERFASVSVAGQGGVETGMGTQSLRQFEQAAMDSRLITVNSTAPKLMTLDPLQNFMVKTRGRNTPPRPMAVWLLHE